MRHIEYKWDRCIETIEQKIYVGSLSLVSINLILSLRWERSREVDKEEKERGRGREKRKDAKRSNLRQPRVITPRLMSLMPIISDHPHLLALPRRHFLLLLYVLVRSPTSHLFSCTLDTQIPYQGATECTRTMDELRRLPEVSWNAKKYKKKRRKYAVLALSTHWAWWSLNTWLACDRRFVATWHLDRCMPIFYPATQFFPTQFVLLLILRV